jgi:peptidoglycan hydrolase-like protein with peptidoglycan-binding domain
MTRPEFNFEPFEFRKKTQAWEHERQHEPMRGGRAVHEGRQPPAHGPWSRAARFDRPSGPCVCPVHGNEFVRWVQSKLNHIEGARLPVDGVMSAAVRSALRQFQSRRRLPADGIAGPENEQALREARRQAPQLQPETARYHSEIYEFETLDLESPATMPTLRQGSRGLSVADLQRRLATAGFSPGAADGIFGSHTDAAVRSFQRAHGLGVDGIVGPQTWGALIGTSPSVPGGSAPWPQPSTASKLSGAHWVDQFPGSKSIDSLVEPFRSSVARFVAALQKAGAPPKINATYRPPERAYLMHYAWSIANEGLSPAAVPLYPGVDIQWVHTDRNGKVDLAASRAAAEEMVRKYGMADKAVLTSRHTEGRAIDMDIAWTGNLVIPDGRSSKVRTIASLPRTGGDNRDLWAVGASYGVIKLVKDRPDPPHWSDDGH